MLEWLKRRVWKARVPPKGIQGSNPCPSAQCNQNQVPHVSAAFVFAGTPVESSLP